MSLRDDIIGALAGSGFLPLDELREECPHLERKQIQDNLYGMIAEGYIEWRKDDVTGAPAYGLTAKGKERLQAAGLEPQTQARRETAETRFEPVAAAKKPPQARQKQNGRREKKDSATVRLAPEGDRKSTPDAISSTPDKQVAHQTETASTKISIKVGEILIVIENS